MSDTEALAELLRKLVAQQGPEKAARTLESMVEDAQAAVLTIVPNVGIHKIPERLLKGTVFVGSEGNLDLSTKRSIEAEYGKILLRLKNTLLSRSWTKIYLIPTGHVTLSLQIKLAVYQLTRINTIDLFYLNGKYIELAFDMRKLLPENFIED
jgi:hypothetical protein